MKNPSPFAAAVATALLTLPALAPTAAHAQTAPTAPAIVQAAATAAPLAEVAITLRQGHIWLDGTLNDKPARFILDSGAGGMIVSAKAAEKFGLTGDGTRGRATGAATVEVKRTKVKNIGIGRALLADQTAYILPLPEEIGECDGLLGYEFFRRYALTIDYAAGRLSVADSSPAAAAPDGTVVLPLSFASNLPIIDARLGDTPVRLKVDTGASHALMLFADYLSKNPAAAPTGRRLRTVIGKGVGGLIYGEFARVRSLTLAGRGDRATGEATLTGIVTELPRRESGAFAGSEVAGQIGAGVLRRFTATFDYPNKRLTLVPNALLAAPYEHNRSGMYADLQPDGRYKIVDVAADTPAAEAGVTTDDELIAVEGKPVSRTDASLIARAFRAPAGTRVRLLLRRGDSPTREVTLTLRDLL